MVGLYDLLLSFFFWLRELVSTSIQIFFFLGSNIYTDLLPKKTSIQIPIDVKLI